MKFPDLQDHIVGSYHALRIGVAVLGALLPPVLLLGGLIRGALPLQGSMSAYYHAGDGLMRDAFVGFLFAVGALLFFYRGFTAKEDWALNLAGLLVWGVALVPMEWACGNQCAPLSVHGALATGFFLSLAYVCWFRAGDTVRLIEEQHERQREAVRLEALKRAARYRRRYKVLGGLLVVSPLAAAASAAFLDPAQPRRVFIFVAEAFGVYAFTLYWIVKSREVRDSHADRLASEGMLTVQQSGVFETAPVSLQDLRGGDSADRAGG
jgi:hypothetical protein